LPDYRAGLPLSYLGMLSFWLVLLMLMVQSIGVADGFSGMVLAVVSQADRKVFWSTLQERLSGRLSAPLEVTEMCIARFTPEGSM